MKMHISLVSIGALFVVVAMEVNASAQYDFVRVTTNNPGPVAFSVPAVSLNDAGQVAFYGTTGVTSQPAGIYRGTAGGPLVNIAAINAANFSSTSLAVSMNDSGTVAFNGKISGGLNGVFTGNGSSITTIATQSGDLAQYGFDNALPSINNQGSVAFTAQKSSFVFGPPGDEILFRQDGPTRVTLVQQARNLPQLSPSLNDLNQTAFYWSNLTGSGSARELWRNTSGTNTLMASNNNFADSIPDGYVINNTGHVLFQGYSFTGSAIFKADGISITPLVTTTGAFSSFNELSFNDPEQFAFLGILRDGSGKGIYTGADPLTSKIIATGDSLDGSIVTDLLFYREGLNDLGQVAFSAKLADGRGGVYIANIAAVPEPATILLSGLGLTVMVPLVYRRFKKGRKQRVSHRTKPGA